MNSMACRTRNLVGDLHYRTPSEQRNAPELEPVLSDSLGERLYGIDLHVRLAVDEFLHGSNLG